MSGKPPLDGSAVYTVSSRRQLERIARTLGVPPEFFKNEHGIGWAGTHDPVRAEKFANSPEGAKLIVSFMAIQDDEVRDQLIRLVIAVSSLKPQA